MNTETPTPQNEIEIWTTRVTRFFTDYWQILACVTAGLFLAGATVVGLIYVTSSSVSEVPKAAQHESNSNAAHQRSKQKEAEADAVRREFEAVEPQREEARRELAKAKNKSREADQKIKPRKEEYEKVRDTPVAVDPDNLDVRERNLLANLRELYPDK